MADTESAAMETQNSHENGLDCDQNTHKTRKESRLMISKIVNENFKSYAGIQELGPFHKVTLNTNNMTYFPSRNLAQLINFCSSYFSRVFPRSLVQMVVVNLMLLMLCFSCLVTVQK